jgi:hypothetical protein
MRILLLCFLLGTAAPFSLAQQFGTVAFANNAATPITLSGNNVHATVALYGSTFIDIADDSLLSQIGLTANTFAPGLFNDGTRSLGMPGDIVRLQVRAWTGGFGSYEAARMAALSGQNVAFNRSHVWFQQVGGGMSPIPSITGPGRFAGLELVPEPSSLLLAFVGCTTLVLFRGRGQRRP